MKLHPWVKAVLMKSCANYINKKIKYIYISIYFLYLNKYIFVGSFGFGTEELVRDIGDSFVCKTKTLFNLKFLRKQRRRGSSQSVPEHYFVSGKICMMK